MKACEDKIVNKGPHGVSPKPIVDDAPKFDLPTVKLSEPPNYKLGNKVCALSIAVASTVLGVCAGGHTEGVRRCTGEAGHQL